MANYVLAEEITLDATGEVIATAAHGSSNSVNLILFRVVSGTITIGGASADAVFSVGTSDGIQQIMLIDGDQLYAKSAAGADIEILRTKGV